MGAYTSHYKVLTTSGDEHYVTMRYNSVTAWYTVLVDLEEIQLRSQRALFDLPSSLFPLIANLSRPLWNPSRILSVNYSSTRKTWFAPEKFDFHIGADSFRFLLTFENRDYVLYRIDGGKFVELPHMMLAQPSRGFQEPKIEIIVLDYEFDAASLADNSPVAIYKVQVALGDAAPYIVHRRFAEIAELNDNMQAAFNGSVLQDNLPAFPSRLPKLLTDHTDPVFLRDRCETLNEYFVKLPKVPFVLENPDFQGFLRPDATAAKATAAGL